LPRSNLAPGICPGQSSFHKLLGPSRGPGSRGRVSSRPCQGPPFGVRWGVPPLVRERDVSLGCGPKPHLACAPRGRHTPLPLGGVTCVLAAPPPAHTGGIASSEDRGFPPHCRFVAAAAVIFRPTSPSTGQLATSGSGGERRWGKRRHGRRSGRHRHHHRHHSGGCGGRARGDVARHAACSLVLAAVAMDLVRRRVCVCT